MMWKIFDKPSNETILNLGFSIEPPNDVLSAVITGVFTYRYAELVDNLGRDIGYYQEFLAINLYGEMDEEDRTRARGMKEDEVQLFHESEGTSYVNEVLFYRFIYDYASKMLAIYRDHAAVQTDYARWLARQTAPDNGLRKYFLHYNNNWALAMQEGLARLQAKIDDRKST